jgi:hypothetical protein
LQLLHMLLQPINTGLALSALPRQGVLLPLLRQLLPLLCGFSLLLRLLFTCLRALHGPLLARQGCARWPGRWGSRGRDVRR